MYSIFNWPIKRLQRKHKQKQKTILILYYKCEIDCLHRVFGVDYDHKFIKYDFPHDFAVQIQLLQLIYHFSMILIYFTFIDYSNQ